MGLPSRRLCPMRKSASFVPQRHSRTSVTLRTAGGRGPLEEPLACIRLGLEFSLPVVWAERKASSPQTAVCPSSSSHSSWEPGQVLAEEIRDPRKIQVFFLTGQCGKDTSQNTDMFNIEGASRAFVCPSLPTFPQLGPGLTETSKCHLHIWPNPQRKSGSMSLLAHE